MSTVSIIQGEDRTLNFQIKEVDSDEVTTYMDLTGATAISMRVADATTSYVEFTLAASEVEVINAELGMFKVQMSDTKTALMKLGTKQSAEVIVDIGTERRIIQLLQVLTVTKRLFP